MWVIAGAERWMPVAALFTLTSALSTKAPDESVTVPDNAAVPAICANAGRPHQIAIKIVKYNPDRVTRVFM
jgi:hypothetical protein